MDAGNADLTDQQYETMKLGYAALWVLVRKNRACLERLHSFNREINVYLTLKTWGSWIDFQALIAKFEPALEAGNAFLQELDAAATIKDVDRAELVKYGEQLALDMKSNTVLPLLAKFRKLPETTQKQVDTAQSTRILAQIEAEDLNLQLSKATRAGFIVHDDGTVTDTAAKLMWMQCAEGQDGPKCLGQILQYNWEMASRIPAHVNQRGGFATFTDWRLPSALELQSLVRTGSRPAMCAEAFPNAPDAIFWSSTQVKPGGRDAWNVYFGTGSLGANDRENSYAVRLVRSV